MIAIKGMTMPKNCGDCFIQERNACPVAHRWTSEDIDRPLWCPLVDLPDTRHNPEDAYREDFGMDEVEE